MTTAREFAARLSDLLRSERNALAEFLIALAEFDRKRLWVDLGHASLFSFLHRDLGLSEGAAYYRKTAAELISKFPEVIEPLRDGRLCFTSIVELAKTVRADNIAEVLPRFFHVSKREAKAITAELQPAETIPQRTVVLPVRASVPQALTLPVAAGTATNVPASAVPFHPGETVHANSGTPVGASARGPRATTEPLTAELDRLYVTVPRSFRKKLAAARDALSHSHPGASDSDILDLALDLLLERAAKRKALVKKPRKTPPSSAPDSDAVPAYVRREVWTRDQGKCQWPLASGGVCGSTRRVEMDHIQPRAKGGPSTVENLRCLCRPHNDLHARETYGDDFMDQFTANPRGSAAREPVAAYGSGHAFAVAAGVARAASSS